MIIEYISVTRFASAKLKKSKGMASSRRKPRASMRTDARGNDQLGGGKPKASYVEKDINKEE